MGSNDDYQTWQTRAAAVSHERDLISSGQAYQQFVVRAVDERGDPVSDYHVEVFTRGGDPNGQENIIEAFDDDPHPYGADKSLRCFHVNLAKVVARGPEGPLAPGHGFFRILSSSPTRAMAPPPAPANEVREVGGEPLDDEGSTELEINLSEHLPQGPGTDFFSPFTTTLVQIRFNREPWPFDGATKLLRWL